MKRLIIAVAAVAVGVSAQAKSAKELSAQVYDFNATVKSTQCKEIKETKTWAAIWDEDYKTVKGTVISVRKQASTKIAGVIWGCDCETIAMPDWRVYPGTAFPTVGGYLFWNASANVPFNVFTTAFAWALFDRIDDGNKVEGVWALVNDDASNALAFLGAGFGKSTYLECRTVLNSMSGNFAGFLLSGSNADGCMFCGSNPCAGEMFCGPLCYAIGAYPYNPYTDLTAAYGTWNIKYNKTASNKLRKSGLLSQSYSFKKAKKDSGDADAVTLLKSIEAAARRGDLGDPYASEDDDDGEIEPEYDEQRGLHVDAADIGKYAYETKAGEGDGDTYEPVRYSADADPDGLVVKALLSIATGDAS